jgi:hypothetical protein
MMEDTFTHSEDRQPNEYHLSVAYSMLATLTTAQDHLIAIEVRSQDSRTRSSC